MTWGGRVVLGAVLLASWLMAREPLRDAVSLEAAPGVRLEVPRSYAFCSPLCRTADSLAMMSSMQLLAMALTAVATYAAWRLVRRRQVGHDAIREGRTAVNAAVAVGLLVLMTVAVPHPMASLVTARPDELRVDFHSHTSSSHDGRGRFDAAARRKWHRDAGFDVAYVSDHRVFDGAEAALAGNPARAGDGTVLLSAYEGRYLDLFVIMLGLRGADTSLIDARRHLREGMTSAGRYPVSVAAPLGLLERDVNARSRDSLPRIRALQVWDGSPVAAWNGQRQRDRLLELADRHGLAVVAGTNHHGWGSTPAAWNLVRIPGWRDLAPDSLGAVIESLLRSGVRDQLRVVERRRPDPRGSLIALAGTAPVAAWDTLATLTPAERLSWMAWGIALGAWNGRRRRRAG